MSAHRPRILVIDDEPQMHRFLQPALTAAGFEPLRADTGADGLRAIATASPDAVVLDLGLPDMDGKDLLRAARAFYSGPVLVLSARDREVEKIASLDIGAEPVIEAGDLEIDLVKRMVSRAGEPVRLSPKEYELLARLAEGDGRVLTHRQLLTAIWGPAHVDDLPYLRVLVGQLRQKIEVEPASPKRVLTEPGVGYRFMR